MQAELINEAEDLENVAINLVVGVPNFRFKNAVSPLSFESVLKNSLRETNPQLLASQLKPHLQTKSLPECTVAQALMGLSDSVSKEGYDNLVWARILNRILLEKERYAADGNQEGQQRLNMVLEPKIDSILGEKLLNLRAKEQWEAFKKALTKQELIDPATRRR